jgi:hypothetical protein
LRLPKRHQPPLGLRDRAPVRNLATLPFLPLAGWLTLEAYRRLPRAYFAYALVTSSVLMVAATALFATSRSRPDAGECGGAGVG